jgi:hypothetical protein
MKRRKVWQLETIVEDEIGFDAAVCQEQAAIELGKMGSMLWHRSASSKTCAPPPS